MSKEPSRRPSMKVRVGTLRVTYRTNPNTPETFDGLAREDEVKVAQQELRKHLLPNQRRGTEQNVKKDQVDVPLCRKPSRGRLGLTPIGKATLNLKLITKIEITDLTTVDVPNLS